MKNIESNEGSAMHDYTHLSDNLVAAYVDGALDSRGRAAVDGHLSWCERCRLQIQVVEESLAEAGLAAERRRPVGAELRIGDRAYELIPTEDDPQIVEVAGLVIADLWRAAERAAETSSGSMVRVQIGHEELAVDLAAFKKATGSMLRGEMPPLGRDRNQLKLAAKSNDAKAESLHRVPAVRSAAMWCESEGARVEFLCDLEGSVFLRVFARRGER